MAIKMTYQVGFTKKLDKSKMLPDTAGITIEDEEIVEAIDVFIVATSEQAAIDWAETVREALGYDDCYFTAVDE